MQSEFYSGKEYNEIKEYKEFPAELYQKPENKVLTENKKIEEYYDKNKSSSVTKKTKDVFSLKDKIEGISKSYGTVAGSVGVTATIAVVAVVATSSVALPPPSVDVDFSFGANFVSYHLEMDDLQQGVDYYLSVSNPKHSFVIDLDEKRESDIITGLLPSHEYKFAVKGKNDVIGDVTYYEKVFQTYSKDVVSAGISTRLTFNVEDGYGVEYQAYLSNLNDKPLEFLFQITDLENNVLYEDDVSTNSYMKGIEYGLPLQPLRASVMATDVESLETQLLTSYLIKPISNAEIQAIALEQTASIEEAIVEWDVEEGYHSLKIPLNIAYNESWGVNYELVLYDEKDRVILSHTVTESEYVVVEIPSTVYKVRAETVLYSSEGEKIATLPYDGELDLTPPTLKLGKFTLSGYNTYQAEYEIIPNSAHTIRYSSIEVFVTNDDGMVGGGGGEYGEYEHKKGILNFSVEDYNVKNAFYEITFYGPYGENVRSVTAPIPVPKLTQEVKILSTYASLVDGYKKLVFKVGVSKYEGLNLVVESSAGSNTYLIDYDSVEIDLNPGLDEYVYYVTDASGQKLVEEKSITVDDSVSGEYEFSYVNPGDIITSLNDDGTYNAHIETDFYSLDVDVYYKITLGFNELEYTFTTPVATIENLTKNYGIRYAVCKKVNGVEYELEVVVPSGSIDKSFYNYGSISVDYTAEYVYMNIGATLADGSVIKAIGDNGEEIIITQDQITDPSFVILPFVERPSAVSLCYTVRPNDLFLEKLNDTAHKYKLEREKEEVFYIG